MKKTVRFLCIVFLIISVFCAGAYLGKIRASRYLLSVLQAHTSKKESRAPENGVFNEDALYSTVSIVIRLKKQEEIKIKYGTGIIYSLNKDAGNATVLTCEHLFYENDFSLSEIELYLYGSEFSQCRIKGRYLGGSETFDCALVGIEDSEALRCSNARSATFETKSTQGQDVYAIGNALGEGISISKGIISRFKEKTTDNFSYPLLQTDAALNFGCSGGGLFSSGGAFLGMICAKQASEAANGIGYALPSFVCDTVARSIVKHGDAMLYLPNFVCVTTPMLDKKEATVSFHLTVAESEDSRIRCGDILLYAVKDGAVTAFADTDSFFEFLLCCENECVTFAFYRHGEIFEISSDVLKQSTIK